jgi:outer membrane protein
MAPVAADVSAHAFLSLPASGAQFPQKDGEVSHRHQFARLMRKRTGISKEFWIHMKRLLVSIAILASGAVLSAVAQTPAASAVPPAGPAAPAGPAKIAVIAFQMAVAQTNEGQRNLAELQKKFDPKRQQLKALSDEIDNLNKQLQTQSATLSDSERSSRASTIDTKKKQLNRDYEDAQSEYQQQMQDLFNGLASKVYDVMQAYAEKEGYTLVLDVSPQQSPVLFASNSADITKPVIAAYNLKSGVAAPPQAPQTSEPLRPGAPTSTVPPAH